MIYIMIIIEQELSNIDKHNFKDIILSEAITRLNNDKHFKSKIFRRRIQEECDNKAFLDSKNLKFPVVNPKTCDVDCNILLKSFYELQKTPMISGKLEMIQEAKQLIQKHGCSKNIRIKFENNFEVELDTLLFYLD